MNKNFSVITIVVILILIIGGLVYAVVRSKNVSLIATSTSQQIMQNNNNSSVNTSPQATAPIVSTNSTVYPSATTAVVSGTVNPKGAFASYWYEYGKTSDLGNNTSVQNMGSGFVSIQAPAYITNLSKDTTYYFRLVAENQYSKIAGNKYTFQTTDSVSVPIGSVPTVKTVSANNISSTTATINGEITPNKNETQYWFEYGTTRDMGNTSAFFSGGNGATKSSVSISLVGLQPKTTYYFRIDAQNKLGTINGLVLNFKTK